MSKVEVPGGWIELRDPKSVSERLRRPVIAKASQLSGAVTVVEGGAVSSEAVTEMFEFNDLIAVALISGWSFDSSVSAESLLDLPGETYDAIQRTVAPMVTDLMPSFEVTPDADSPTGPSSV